LPSPWRLFASFLFHPTQVGSFPLPLPPAEGGCPSVPTALFYFSACADKLDAPGPFLKSLLLLSLWTPPPPPRTFGTPFLPEVRAVFFTHVLDHPVLLSFDGLLPLSSLAPFVRSNLPPPPWSHLLTGHIPLCPASPKCTFCGGRLVPRDPGLAHKDPVTLFCDLASRLRCDQVTGRGGAIDPLYPPLSGRKCSSGSFFPH